jgi:hypothetical protein
MIKKDPAQYYFKINWKKVVIRLLIAISLIQFLRIVSILPGTWGVVHIQNLI